MNLSADWLMQAALRATLLFAGLFVIWRFLPAGRPALRRQVLLCIAAGLLLAPWLSGWWNIGIPREAGHTNQMAGQIQSYPWPGVFAACWFTGSALALVRLGRQSLALHRIIRRARPWAGPVSVPDLTVLQSSAISGPCVAGGRKPVLLLPACAHHWTPAQWQMVLAHETQHLHQHDLKFSWLPRLVQCLYWWHPLSIWLTRQFHAESEALCDRAVLIRSGHQPREYIEFLLSLNAARMPAHASGMALKSPLGHRIERLLQNAPDTFNWWAVTSLSLLLGITTVAFSLRTTPPAGRPAEESVVGLNPTSPEAPDKTSMAIEVQQRLNADPFPND